MFGENFDLFFVNIATLLHLFHSICIDVSQDVPTESFPCWLYGLHRCDPCTQGSHNVTSLKHAKIDKNKTFTLKVHKILIIKKQSCNTNICILIFLRVFVNILKSTNGFPIVFSKSDLTGVGIFFDRNFFLKSQTSLNMF